MLDMLSVGDQPVAGYVLDEDLGGSVYFRNFKVKTPDGGYRHWKLIDMVLGSTALETRNIEILSKVHHPRLNTVQQHWAIESEKLFILQTDLPQSTLRELIDNAKAEGQPIPVEIVLKYLSEAAEGLDFLNKQQHDFGEGKVAIYHRNLRPEALALFEVDGALECRVAEFGLSKPSSEEIGQYSQGLVNYEYMPPEFFEGRTAPTSDQYALAINYYEMRTFGLPFKGNMIQQLQARMTDKIDLSLIGEAERAVIRRALSRDPGQRFSSCYELMNRLKEAVTAPAPAVVAPAAAEAAPVEPAQPAQEPAAQPARRAMVLPGQAAGSAVRPAAASGTGTTTAGGPTPAAVSTAQAKRPPTRRASTLPPIPGQASQQPAGAAPPIEEEPEITVEPEIIAEAAPAPIEPEPVYAPEPHPSDSNGYGHDPLESGPAEPETAPSPSLPASPSARRVDSTTRTGAHAPPPPNPKRPSTVSAPARPGSGPDLRTRIGSLELRNPILMSTRTIDYKRESAALAPLRRLGGIIGRTITIDSDSEGKQKAKVDTTSCSLVDIAAANDPVEEFLEKRHNYMKQSGTRVILNIAGYSVEGFQWLAERLAIVDVIDALELNFTVPNVAGGIDLGHDVQLVSDTIEAVRRACDFPLIAQLSYQAGDLPTVAQAAQVAGADAISLLSTVVGLAVDWRGKKSKLPSFAGLLTGAFLKPMALYAVHQTSRSVTIPIIASGGIMNINDVMEYIIAGASMVAIEPTGGFDPMGCAKIVEQLPQGLAGLACTSIDKAVGLLETPEL